MQKKEKCKRYAFIFHVVRLTIYFSPGKMNPHTWTAFNGTSPDEIAATTFMMRAATLTVSWNWINFWIFAYTDLPHRTTCAYERCSKLFGRFTESKELDIVLSSRAILTNTQIADKKRGWFKSNYSVLQNGDRMYNPQAGTSPMKCKYATFTNKELQKSNTNPAQ